MSNFWGQANRSKHDVRFFFGICVFAAAVLSGANVGAAQTGQPAEPDIIYWPGLGEVDVSQLPEEIRSNLRIPGEEYTDTPRPYEDLPPSQNPEAQVIRPEDIVEVPPGRSFFPTPKPRPTPTKPILEQIIPGLAQEKDIEDKEREHSRQSELDAIREMLPEDAYLQALRQIQAMETSLDATPTPAPSEMPTANSQFDVTATPQIVASPTPQINQLSARDKFLKWLNPELYVNLLTNALMPRTARALPLLCQASPPWKQLGPAPYTEQTNPQIRAAGIVKSIAIDPRNSQRIYIGTRQGGIWMTNDGGTSWTTTTDNLASPNVTSLMTQTIALDPTTLSGGGNSNIILAGTGQGPLIEDSTNSALDRSVGTLRSTDGGATWNQIGPAWCLGATTPSSGTPTPTPSSCLSGTTCISADPVHCPVTSPYNSTINVKELATDSAGGVWAATSRGLWHSTNARTATNTQVVWNRKALTAQSGGSTIALVVPATGLPDGFNHIFISPLSNAVMYASVNSVDTSADQSHRGWYKSTDTGATWTKLPNPTGTNPDGSAWGYPSGINVRRAAIAHTPNAGANTDVLYAIMDRAFCGGGDAPCPEGPTTQCGGNSVLGNRLFRGVSTGLNINWSLVTTNGGSCQTAADCCDPTNIGGCSCLSNGVAVQQCPKGCDGTTNCVCDNGQPDCQNMLTVQVDPTDPNTVVLGALDLNASLSGGNFKKIGAGNGVHADVNALTFKSHNIIYVGDDGGISTTNLTSSPLTWTNPVNTLANFEFYTGTIDNMNYGVSFGGTQDNGDIKGGISNLWTHYIRGDGLEGIFDPKDSRVIYANDGVVVKTIDGGRAPFCNVSSQFHTGIVPNTLTMDPIDNHTLVVYLDGRVYRTITGGDTFAYETPPLDCPYNYTPPTPGWSPVSQAPTPGPGVPEFRTLALARPPAPTPRASVMFGAGFGSVWRTMDAANWSQISVTPSGGFGYFTRLVIDPTTVCGASQQLCSASCPCTLYATLLNGPHLYRSTDSGVNWQDIVGTDLPDMPFYDVVVDPNNTDPSVDTRIFVATELGVYLGTLSSGNWSWCPYSSGFPKTAIVSKLEIHPESGTLRAFTFGRSVWEVAAFPPTNRDYQVDTSSTVKNAKNASVSSNIDGSYFGVTWLDDSSGTNNWHVQFRGFTYDVNSQPAAIADQVPVDDNSSHIANAPAVSLDPNPFAGDPQGCAWVAWQDNRTSANNIFFQHICPSGTKRWSQDLQASSTSGSTNPAIVAQPGGDMAVAWQRANNVYVRFITWFGLPKSPQSCNSLSECKVNSGTATASRPALATDANGYVFVAWEELDATTNTARILVNKYDADGHCLIGSNAGCVNGPSVELEQMLAGQPLSYVARSQVRLSTDNANNVIATWWEGPAFGQAKIVAKRCNGNLGSCTFLDGCDECLGGDNNDLPCQTDSDCPCNGCTSGGMCAKRVSCPPAAPRDTQDATLPSVATDDNGSGQAGNIFIGWQGNANGPGTIYSGFGAGFDASLARLKEDFRTDLAKQYSVTAPSVARGSAAKSYVVTWQDGRPVNPTPGSHVFLRLADTGS